MGKALSIRIKISLLLAFFIVPVVMGFAQTTDTTSVLHPQAYFVDKNVRKAVIPFTSVNNLIIIPLQLNNVVPLKFLLDTGVKTPLLIERLYSDILHIEYERKLSLRGGGQEAPVEAYLAPNVAFKLPQVQLDQQTMLVLQEDYLQLSKQLGTEVHGIIGATIFKQFVVEIDYEALEITLHNPVYFRKPLGYQEFGLSVEGAKPYIEVEVTGADNQKDTLRVLLDTGASHALLLHNERACVAKPDSTIRGKLGRGLLGDISGDIGRIPYMAMGKYNFSDVLVSFPDEESYAISSAKIERDGTIGGEFLRRFSTYIDYPNNKLYLQRSSNYRDDFVFTKTGIELEADGDDLRTFIITSVRENSSGERAGIQTGDKLIKVGGRKTKNMELSQILERFRGRDGRKLKIKLLRNEQEINCTLILQDML